MKMQIPAWFRPAAWGAALGAAALAIVGFSSFGWMLGATAERMAVARADAAVVTVFVPVCVARFRQQPDSAARIDQLRQTASWQRRDIVERGGWATMPGNDRPNGGIATACAESLVSLSL